MKQLKCDLAYMMAKNNIRSVSELQRKTKLPRLTISRLMDNEASLMDYGTTITLCTFFNCKIEDLYKLVDESEIERIKEANDRRKQNLRNGVVYFAKGENGLVKIGKTIRLERRLDQLSKQTGMTLELIHHIEAEDAIKSEKEMHDRFSRKRVEGEWFRLSDEDIEKIKEEGK